MFRANDIKITCGTAVWTYNTGMAYTPSTSRPGLFGSDELVAPHLAARAGNLRRAQPEPHN
jgi:hypothetical protein